MTVAWKCRYRQTSILWSRRTGTQIESYGGNMSKEVIKKVLKILLIIYSIVLIYILFLYGARIGNQFHLAIFSKEHIEMINIVPFKTLLGFVERINNSTINTSIVLQNIFANLLMFIPMGMVLPVLFKEKFNKLWKMLIFIICFVLIVEMIQILAFCGSSDIDDLILNTVGCLWGYGIVQIRFIRKILKLDE